MLLVVVTLMQVAQLQPTLVTDPTLTRCAASASQSARPFARAAASASPLHMQHTHWLCSSVGDKDNNNTNTGAVGTYTRICCCIKTVHSYVTFYHQVAVVGTWTAPRQLPPREA